MSSGWQTSALGALFLACVRMFGPGTLPSFVRVHEWSVPSPVAVHWCAHLPGASVYGVHRCKSLCTESLVLRLCTVLVLVVQNGNKSLVHSLVC